MAGGGGQEEINLVPYLDVMVNLIMFMITVTAYIVELKEAPVLPPSYGEGGGGGEQKAFGNVNITQTGIVLLDSKSRFTATLPKEGDTYPFGKLTETLRSYRGQFPDISDNLVLAADPVVPYSAVVAAMDAARKDQQGPLFPGVTLALAIQ